MNNVTHFIVDDSGLIGNIHRNNSPFVPSPFVVSIGDVCYYHYSLDWAIQCAMRHLPAGASIVRN
jgi:hypothetical protein